MAEIRASVMTFPGFAGPVAVQLASDTDSPNESTDLVTLTVLK